MGRFSAGEMNLQLKNTKTNETLIVLGAAGHDLTAICFAKKIINNAMDLFEIRAMGLWAGVIAGSIVGLSAEGCVYGVTAQ